MPNPESKMTPWYTRLTPDTDALSTLAYFRLNDFLDILEASEDKTHERAKLLVKTTRLLFNTWSQHYDVGVQRGGSRVEDRLGCGSGSGSEKEKGKRDGEVVECVRATMVTLIEGVEGVHVAAVQGRPSDLEACAGELYGFVV